MQDIDQMIRSGSETKQDMPIQKIMNVMQLSKAYRKKYNTAQLENCHLIRWQFSFLASTAVLSGKNQIGI